MSVPNKLQKQVVNNRCKGIHKYRRFSLKNKTYRTDCYYCSYCGHKVKIEDFFGYTTICWGCGDAFSVPAGQLKIFPKCSECLTGIPDKRLNTPELKQEWEKEKVSREEVLDEMLADLGLK